MRQNNLREIDKLVRTRVNIENNSRLEGIAKQGANREDVFDRNRENEEINAGHLAPI